MQNDYAYSVAQCDVAADKRGGLQSYRDKRRLWLSWIDTDEHHAIWRVLSSMVWTDVSFKTLTQLAISDENNTLHNTLLAQALRSLGRRRRFARGFGSLSVHLHLTAGRSFRRDTARP